MLDSTRSREKEIIGAFSKVREESISNVFTVYLVIFLYAGIIEDDKNFEKSQFKLSRRKYLLQIDQAIYFKKLDTLYLISPDVMIDKSSPNAIFKIDSREKFQEIMALSSSLLDDSSWAFIAM